MPLFGLAFFLGGFGLPWVTFAIDDRRFGRAERAATVYFIWKYFLSVPFGMYCDVIQIAKMVRVTHPTQSFQIIGCAITHPTRF